MPAACGVAYQQAPRSPIRCPTRTSSVSISAQARCQCCISWPASRCLSSARNRLLISESSEVTTCSCSMDSPLCLSAQRKNTKELLRSLLALARSFMESSRQPSSAPTALPTFYSEDLMNEAASDESVFRDLLQKVGSHKGESGVRERQETGT